MKTVKLHNGQEIKLPSSMTDLDVQRVVKLLMDKLGEIQAYEKSKEVVLINTEFPEFPEFPPFPEMPKSTDYSKVLNEIVGAYKSHTKEVVSETKALNKSINSLSDKIDRQTEALTKALNMQNEVLAELVVAYREPKKIMRDRMGRPEGIE